MMDETLMDFMEEAMKKGERARVLWETFLETIGSERTENLKVMMDKFKQTQDDYYEAINKIRIVTEQVLKQKMDTREHDSANNTL